MREKRKLYELFLIEDAVDAQAIRDLGFSNMNIVIMCAMGELKRVDGKYVLENVGGLYELGEVFSQEKNYYKAKMCFERCLEKNRLHYGANVRMFYNALLLRRYNDSLRYLDALGEIDSPYVRADYLFYLYMLGHIIDLPDGYCAKVKNLSKKSIAIPDGTVNYRDLDRYDAVRNHCYRQEFFEAYRQLIIIQHDGDKSFECLVTEKLIFLARTAAHRKNSKLSNMIRRSNFEGIIALLDRDKKAHQLRIVEQAYYHLAKMIVEMKTCGTIPIPYGEDLANMFYNISHNKIEAAYAYNLAYAKKNDISNDTNHIGLLLRKAVICKFYVGMKREDCAFAQFIGFLYSKQYNSCYRLIDVLGLKEYAYLVKLAISLSNLEGDKLKTRPIVLVNDLLRGLRKIDVAEYLRELTSAIENGDLQRANVLVSLIGQAAKNGHTDLSEDEVRTLLEDVRNGKLKADSKCFAMKKKKKAKTEDK